MLPASAVLPADLARPARIGSLLFAVSLIALVPLSVSAATISGTALPFTGDSLSASVVVDDAADPGNLVITVEVDGGGNIGDLRGAFFHVTDEALVSGLSVAGTGITDSDFDTNGVINLGGGSNLNGGGTPCDCDFGVEIGTSGMGSDDIRSVTFTLSHISASLDVSLLSDEAFGVRATSVGPEGGSRGGSSKLSGTLVPEPTSAFLILLGLGGLAHLRRRTR